MNSMKLGVPCDVPNQSLALVQLAVLAALIPLLIAAGPAEAPLQVPSQPSPPATSSPPEDPLFTQDISAWTYTEEFAERFKRLKMKERGPTGAYAVNFQVHQIDELDRCVFNVFLDNRLPIDYPDGPVGFLPFTYPTSWAFLNLSPEDQHVVDSTYLSKYRDQRAVLKDGTGGERPLAWFQYRTHLYRGVAVITLTVRCDQVPAWKNPIRLNLRTTGDTLHEIELPEHFLGWIHATLTKWRRPEAKIVEKDLPDQNVWSYTPEFANRFGLPPLDEPGPTGAEAVAWRVVQYNREEQFCFLDVYLDETVPLVLPEAEHGFSGSQPQLGYFIGLKDRADVLGWFPPYHVYGNTELFFVRELSERQIQRVPHKERIKGNLFRIVNRSPFSFDRYRKRAFPRLSYIAFDIGCMEPPVGKSGPVGFTVAKTDGAKHEVILPTPFTERVFLDWRVRVQIPLRCRTPKLYPREHCAKR